MGYTGEKKRAYQREWLRKRRMSSIEAMGGECAKCGSKDRLEIDHIVRSEKKFEPRDLWSRNEKDRNAELSKCQVLCYSCHKQKTSAERYRQPCGTYSSYSRGCRCDDCRLANRDRSRRQRAKKLEQQ